MVHEILHLKEFVQFEFLRLLFVVEGVSSTQHRRVKQNDHYLFSPACSAFALLFSVSEEGPDRFFKNIFCLSFFQSRPWYMSHCVEETVCQNSQPCIKYSIIIIQTTIQKSNVLVFEHTSVLCHCWDPHLHSAPHQQRFQVEEWSSRHLFLS